MSYKSSKDIKLMLHPYAFILKGGDKIDEDLLDYQLMIVQVHCPETIKSPENVRSRFKYSGQTINFIKSPIISTPNKEPSPEVNPALSE